MGVYRGVAQDNVTITSGRAKLDLLARNAPATLKTASFTVADNETHIICNGAASLTATLPSASLWAGREIYMKTIAAHTVVSAATNVKPINSNTAGTGILAGTAGAWALLVSDGTNWVIMAS
jgi:hypothetical protein